MNPSQGKVDYSYQSELKYLGEWTKTRNTEAWCRTINGTKSGCYEEICKTDGKQKDCSRSGDLAIKAAYLEQQKSNIREKNDIHCLDMNLDGCLAAFERRGFSLPSGELKELQRTVCGVNGRLCRRGVLSETMHFQREAECEQAAARFHDGTLSDPKTRERMNWVFLKGTPDDPHARPTFGEAILKRHQDGEFGSDGNKSGNTCYISAIVDEIFTR